MANNIYPAKNEMTLNPVTPITPEQLNRTASKQPNVGGLTGFLDNLISGFAFIVDLLGWVFTGFPRFLMQVGVPAIVYGPIAALFLLVWAVFMFEILTGRQITE